MRSKGITFLLVLLAAAFCAVAGWQWTTGNFHALFGTPPTPVGEHLYPHLRADDVHRIEVKTGSSIAVLRRDERGWLAVEPWKDRADPRIAGGIIAFTRGMKVEDSTPVEEARHVRSSLRENGVSITLSDASGDEIVHYLLGRAAPWKAEDKDNPEPIPTVFVRRRESGRTNEIYVATGDINSLFKDNLRYLRDHHPFSFHPAALEKITLTTPEGAITLGRENPGAAWRIVKPLDLPTDVVAVRRLIERLFEMQAVKVTDRNGMTLPAGAEDARTIRVSIRSFGSDQETTLEIHPPDSPAGTEASATVSDRPGAIFSLLVKPERGLVSLADLPFKLQELRDPSLTHLDIAAIRGILIQSVTNPEILITREPPAPWKISSAGKSYDANEENLYRLLKNITTARATEIATDAATDFTPWGLDKPFLTLRFLAADNRALEIRFGMDGKGGFYANRLGTPTVMKVDELLVRSVATRPYEWMPSRAWTINRVFLTGVIRETAGQPTLVLKYNDNFESWSGERNGRDITGDIDGIRAGQLLDELENLKTTRWLAADDEEARRALLSPALKFTVVERKENDEGEAAGVASHVLVLAPQGDPARATAWYGSTTASPHPFLIDAAVAKKLAARVTN